jgi:hypothetical protein
MPTENILDFIGPEGLIRGEYVCRICLNVGLAGYFKVPKRVGLDMWVETDTEGARVLKYHNRTYSKVAPANWRMWVQSKTT